ncbi:Deoxycytidine monophosphate (dCMP) deaminase [Aspergillus nanangensis]|uniref:Deoxycytidine monophosphate (dCMP) deaminase n=1 Tax=Aspergillus nanangensis TaxID=2582783 RepID=A0AAD4CJS2_ASPNN|nr:Deoxycytidine monophosphate (dCMP) deaminase [Aspergillus nanangensis]
MLIGLCGGICSGKHTIAEYLIQHQGFQLLELKNKNDPKLADGPEDDLRLQASEFTKTESSQLPQLSFESLDVLLEFATKQWQGLWVTTDISEGAILDRFLLRPFFLLVSVDAPVSLRWKRFSERCRKRQLAPPELEKFVLWNDRNLYEKNKGRAYLIDRAQVRLFNSSSSLEQLYSSLQALNLADDQRLRPHWDQYFMELASLAAQRSNCMKRRAQDVIGAMVEALGCLRACVSMPRKTPYWRLEGIAYERVRYFTATLKIAQVGISEVVYSQGYNMDQESAAILETAGIRLRQFSPPRNGLIYLEGPVDVASQ